MGIRIAKEPSEARTCFACLQPFVFEGRTNSCAACTAFMNAGIICIGVRDDCPHDGIANCKADYYRDGNWCVATADHVRELLSVNKLSGQPTRYLYIKHATWMRLGLPRAGKSGASQTRKGKYEAQAED